MVRAYAYAALVVAALGLGGYLSTVGDGFQPSRHDPQFVVALPHVTIGGVWVFLVCAGVALYFRNSTGRELSRALGRVHLAATAGSLVGVLVAATMLAESMTGPDERGSYVSAWLLLLAALGALVLSQLVFVANLIVSWRRGK